MARKHFLTATIKHQICDLVAAGTPWSEIATTVGIPATTIHNWRKRGREGGQRRFTAFEESVQDALEIAEQNLLDVLRTAATEKTTEREVVNYGTDPKTGMNVKRTIKEKPPDWRAAMALLELQNPQRYRRNGGGEPAIPGATAEVRLRFGVSDDEMAQLKEQWMARRREAGLPIDLSGDEVSTQPVETTE